MTSRIGVASRTTGAASPACISALDAHQPRPELAARVEGRELLLAEALAHQQRHRQRVAERERRRGARGRHQVHRAGLFGDAAVERDVGRLRRASTRGEPVIAISLRADPADRFEQPEQLLGLAAVRQREHHVVVPDGAEVAVD